MASVNNPAITCNVFYFYVIALDFHTRIFSKVLELCTEKTDTRKDYRELMSNPGFVSDKFARPNKEEAIGKFISRFSNVQPVGRPEGSEGITEPARVISLNRKKKKKTSQDKSKKTSKRKPAEENESEPSSSTSKPGKKHRKK
jgi:hypothetical protein